MAVKLGKLTYVDLVFTPRSDDTEVSRFYHHLYDIHNRMSGRVTDNERVITVGDLSSVLTDVDDNLLVPTRWRDFNVGAIGLGKGASAPDQEVYNGTNILMSAFDGNVTTEQLYGSIELDHMYKEGTDIYFHIHWCPTTTNAGNVVWQLEYTIQDGGIVSTGTTIRVQTASPGVAYKMTRSDFPAINGSSLRMGNQFTFRLFRDPTYNSGGLSDTYGYDALVATVGLHVEVDGFGSKAMTSKN